MVGKARKMNNDSIDRKNQKEDVAFRKFDIGFCFKVMMINDPMKNKKRNIKGKKIE